MATMGTLCSNAGATTIYVESVSGDFSNSGLLPTAVSFALGSNQIFGTTGRLIAGGSVDRDYLTFMVPIGDVLASLTVLPGTLSLPGAGGGPPLSFIGL